MLTIQFGQCGNQLGHTLLSKISSDISCRNTGVPYNVNYQYSEDTFNKWFSGITKNGKHLARAILIDTEPKVIHKIYNETTMPWSYRTKNIICHIEGGCANNWANGYMIKGKELCDTISNTIQQELERIDRFEGFFMLLSSAGGTGSGVGSRTIELLREEYKTKCIISTAILPFSFGEVCTQNYNTLLTLDKLYKQSDMTILFDNEQIHTMCTNLLKKSTTHLHDINEVISEKLMAVFQPTNNINYSINSFVSQVASHPSYKLATIKTTPHVSVKSTIYEPVYNWSTYIHHLKQMLRISNSSSELTDTEIKMPSSLLSDTTHHSYACCVSNTLITRGTATEKDFVVPDELEQKYLYADWIVADRLVHLHQKRKIFNRDKFLALVTNNSQISQSLDVLLNKTWNSYVHAAFLHQYKQFGLEDDNFLETFAEVENIVKNYKELINYKIKL